MLSESQRAVREGHSESNAANRAESLDGIDGIDVDLLSGRRGCSDVGVAVLSGVPGQDRQADEPDVDELVFRSRIVEGINTLRADLVTLQSELRQLKLDSQASVIPPPSKVCTLYVRLGVTMHACPPGKTLLESELKCQVLQYVCVNNQQPTYAFKVKIRETDLLCAMTAGKEPGCFVDLWKSPLVTRSPQNGPGGAAMHVPSPQSVSSKPSGSKLKLSSWNCQGLTNSTQYLQKLIEEGSKVVVLSSIGCGHMRWTDSTR